MISAGSGSPVSADGTAQPPATSEAGHQDVQSADGNADFVSPAADQLHHDLPQDAWGVDPATGALIGDSIAVGDSGADLAELHAALATLSSDAFAYLDIALDHLTSSSDLFDVPAMDFGDLGGDSTGS